MHPLGDTALSSEVLTILREPVNRAQIRFIRWQHLHRYNDTPPSSSVSSTWYSEASV
jgi:hypothetical protein